MAARPSDLPNLAAFPLLAVIARLFTGAAWACDGDECPLFPEGFTGVGILAVLLVFDRYPQLPIDMESVSVSEGLPPVVPCAFIG